MFYRRKILLALVEVFGGTLSQIDCHMLLFLFCLRRKSSYYDFFPHAQGAFSLVLQQDKNRLADLGFLTSHQNFQLHNCQSYQSQLKVKDRAVLQSLVSEIGDIRSEGLLRKTYLEVPQFASRSQIVSQVLTTQEYGYVRCPGHKVPASCLFTIGYEGLSIDAYLDILIANHITALVDVRKNPISMKYGFSKTQLAYATKLAGISYIHLPDLGIPSYLRKNLNCEYAYQNLFNYYLTQILPAHTGAIEQLKGILNDFGRVALTCFEAKHTSCHRHKIIEYLETDQYFAMPVVHLAKNCTCFTSLNQAGNEHCFNRLLDENALYSFIENASP